MLYLPYREVEDELKYIAEIGFKTQYNKLVRL